MNVYDIETYLKEEDNRLIPYCVAYKIDNKYYYNYYTYKKNIIRISIDFIFSLDHKKLIIYTHNINFDGLLIIDEISKYDDISIDSLIRNMNIYWVKLKKNNKEVLFKCSYKIMPESLSKISEIFDIKKKLVFPYKFASEKNLNYIGEIPDISWFNNREDYAFLKTTVSIFNFKEYSIMYCLNDVQIASSFLEKFRFILLKQKIDINSVYSAPSLSFKIFESKFNKKRASFDMHLRDDEVIRSSYFGGRCEVYGNPEKKEYIHYYDFSGMYGQCMREKFPCGKLYRENYPKDFSIPGFYYIIYDSSSDMPVLPHKSKINGKLMFVNGLNEGLFWYEEILLFIEHGGNILDIKFSILYENFDNIFIEFVEEFEELKKISEIHKKFGKLIINSLYGRLGMGFLDEESLIIRKSDFVEYNKKSKILSFIILNNIVLINIEKIKNSKIKNNIALASAITSKARIKLYKAQNDVIKNGGRLLYSDTDSIFAAYTEKFYDKVHGTVDWSKENIEIKDAVFISPKTYAYISEKEEIIKIKGFNTKSVKFNELKESFYSNYKTIKMAKEQKILKKNISIYSIEEEKNLNLATYDKRSFICDKKKTLPFKIKEDLNYDISRPIEWRK